MSSPNDSSHKAHRDPSGDYSQILPYPGKFEITPKEAVNNAVFNIFKHKKDIEECLNVTNLKYCSQGAYGQIFRCLDQQDSEGPYAIKILKAKYAGPGYMTYWTNKTKCEISCLKKLNHPNILKYVDHCWLDSDKVDRCFVALKTEYLDVTLDNHLKALKGPMDYHEFKRFFNQIGPALAYMHEMGVAHLDIKGSNIMINQDKVWKILDFGNTHFYAGPKEQALESEFFLGTLLYNCPCKRDKEPYNPFLSDPYSLGMILWQCILGIENVFCDKNDKEYAKKMKPAWEIIEETVWPKLEQDDKIGPHHLAARRLVAPLGERVFVSEALELFEQEDRML